MANLPAEDVVAELKDIGKWFENSVAARAAHEIERLRAEVSYWKARCGIAPGEETDAFKRPAADVGEKP